MEWKVWWGKRDRLSGDVQFVLPMSLLSTLLTYIFGIMF